MRRQLAALLACALLGAACATSEGYAQGEPPPPSSLPPPPPDALGTASAPGGEWVLTQQYGWVWMPYSDAYVYVPPSGVGEPLEYLYYPSYGWAWFSAPWIWGVGPSPRFGRVGPRHFAWYERGWWQEPRRWRYQPAPEPRGPSVARGVRAPPPARPSAQARPPAAQGRTQGRGAQRRGEARGGERRAAPAPAPARPGSREGDRGRGEGRDRDDDRR